MNIKTVRYYIFSWCFLAFLLPKHIVAQASLGENRLNTFLEVAEELFNKAELPGAGMAIVYGGEVLYTGGFGYADVERKMPIDEHSLFFIGSTTKALTGFAAAKLVERGLLDWKRPIVSYLPDFTLSEPYVAQHINLEDLFTHMSGLAQKDELWLGKNISREEVFQQTETLPFATSFREVWGYNNHTYVIIGKVMEEVTGKSWEQIIQEEIFTPLKMDNSHLTHEDFLQDAKHVKGYYGDGMTERPHINFDNIAPAGGISSTPHDIAKWLQLLTGLGAFQGETMILDEGFDYLTKPKGMSFTDTCSVRYYSIGWGGSMTEGRRTLRHNGAIAGNNARVSVMPDDGFGIFVMTNQRSDFKDILTDYAESIFVNGDFKRNAEREAKMISLNRFLQFQNRVLDYSIEEAKAYYATIEYKDFEQQMQRLGNSLLEAGYVKEAIMVLGFNAADHPNAFTAQMDFGQALAKIGRNKEAVAAFERALEIDPASELAKTALRELEQD